MTAARQSRRRRVRERDASVNDMRPLFGPGENATEDEARNALAVVRTIAGIMNSIAVPAVYP